MQQAFPIKGKFYSTRWVSAALARPHGQPPRLVRRPIQCRSPWTEGIRSPNITRESSFQVENLLSTPKCWYVRRRAGARRPTLRDSILQSKPYSPNPMCLPLGPVPNTLSLSYPGYHWTRRRSYRSITTS